MSPDLNKTPSALSSVFLQGKTATIQTNFAEGGTGGTVNLYDPWHYYTDSQGNWSQSKTFNSYSSPLSIQNNSTSSYGGVFLNQGGTSFTPPYYQISVPSVQTISVNGVNRTFYFQNWTTSNAAVQNAGSTQTPVVFTSEGAVISANYKGHLLSNNTAGLSTSCQSKVITDDFGNYDLVYESLGNVWFTISTDGGNTWSKEIKVNLDGTQAKCPSISCPNDDVGFIFITYESDCDAVGWPTHPSILLNEYKNNSLVSINNVDTVSSYSFNSYPVVTSINTYILVTYKAGPASNLRAVEFRNQVTGSYAVTVNQTFNSLPGTNTNSINPSLTSQELVSPKYFLAFEQSDTNAIRYLEWPVGSNVMNYTPVNISNGNGGYYNHYPSISQNSGNAVVSWTGTVGPYPVAVIKRKNNGTWTSFYKASGYMTTTSNNSRKYTGEGAYIAWLNTYSLQNPVTQFIELDSNVFSQIATLPSAGDVRLSDGNNMSDIRAIQFFNTTLPYVVQPHGVSLHTNLGKANSNTDIRYGRSAIVSVEGTEYEFFLGGIKLNGQNILFNKNNNTTALQDIDGLSNSLVTQKFTLNANSNFSFDSHSHVIKHLQNDSSGNKNKEVSFAIELISSKDNSTAGRFNPVILLKDNDSNDVNINVNCKGIQAGDYYFRVAVKTDNQVSSFDIADYQYEYISSLMKKESSNLNYTGDPPIKEYDLCQNYPNPFNPSTVIEYQLPKDGYVTLKVYDILGREVKTLVNGYKTIGKYSVSFDASRFASGVYIYELKSNDFRSIKKMILTK